MKRSQKLRAQFYYFGYQGVLLLLAAITLGCLGLAAYLDQSTLCYLLGGIGIACLAIGLASISEGKRLHRLYLDELDTEDLRSIRPHFSSQNVNL